MARLRLGFESALARESLRRGDGTSCHDWQARAQLAARPANACAQRNAAGRVVLPLGESAAGLEQDLPKQPVALWPAPAPWPLPPVFFGSPRACRGSPGGSAGWLFPTARELRMAMAQAGECLRWQAEPKMRVWCWVALRKCCFTLGYFVLHGAHKKFISAR